MRQLRVLTFGLVISGLALLLMVGVAAAQGGTDTTYTGSETCQTCHQGVSRDHADSYHSLALIDVQDGDAASLVAVVADFSQGEDVRTLTLPGADSARPITLDDVAYVIGAGQHAQRFLVPEDDGSYVVLPIEWNAAEAQWQLFELAESWPDEAYGWENCAYCHTTGLDVEAMTWLNDGVQCEACHGPGTTHVELAGEPGTRYSFEELAAVRGSIFNAPDSQACGQCHTRGVDAATSLPYPTAYQPGGDLLAGYELYGPDDTTHWWASGHASQPNMQFNEWFETAHATAHESVQDSDYAADSCLECHSGDFRYATEIAALIDAGVLRGIPPEVTVETAAYGVACQTCHQPHQASGNAFYLVDEPYALCVDCHNTAEFTGDGIHHPVQEIFEGQPLVAEVVGMPSGHFTAEDGAECTTCHMPGIPVSEGTRASHALAVVHPDGPEALLDVASCAACHEDVVEADLQSLFNEVQGSLTSRIEVAEAALTDSSPTWVVNAVAAVAGDNSGGIHNYGYTSALLSAAEGELGIVRETLEPEPAPEWVTLPLVGEVRNLTVAGLIGGGLGFLVGLIAGLVLIRRRGWPRLLGGLFLLVALVLVVLLVVLFVQPTPRGVASGEDAYCLVCHGSTSQQLVLADGTLDLTVNAQAMDASVHGTESEIGRIGCVDCHGADAFPHGGALPTSLREYRLDMSNICADCHMDSLDHYERVLDRNVAVGCADCHSAHEVHPAETLENLPPHVIENEQGTPIPPPGISTVVIPTSVPATDTPDAAAADPLDAPAD
jgi:predicted CXXCH cytochrome family protein